VDEIEFTVVDAASDDARWARAQYFAELNRRFPNGFDPGATVDDDDAALFAPPSGLFVTALRDGATIGCGALSLHDEQTAEIKRMWISPDSRGLGVGRRLLSALEDHCREAGRQRVVLDTNGTLREAIALYRSCGYVEIERYNDNPYAQHWFEKYLSG
jgi:ribosomal protein S18 acetylase RimI-like enzyme